MTRSYNRQTRLLAGQKYIQADGTETILSEDLVWCARCRKYLPKASFARTGKYCRQCHANYYQETRTSEDDQKKNLRKNYNLSLEEYRALFTAQQGRCAACGQPERSRSAKTNEIHYLAVDHDHDTGKVRALLCRNCNSALGFLDEDPDKIRQLLAYAEQVAGRGWQSPIIGR